MSVHISLPDYLRAPCEHLWRWQDNGDAIVWCADPVTDTDESTAAFSSQLHLILSDLNTRLGGLPPLICLLTVLDLCGSQWSLDDWTTRIARLVRESSRRGRRADRLDPSSGPVEEISDWFSKVWLLPREMRADLSMQLAILTYALQDLPDDMLESVGLEATDVLECISIAASDRDLNWDSAAVAAPSAARAKLAINALWYMASRPIDAESIETWRQTGVGDLPVSAPMEELPEPRDPIGQTMRELAEDSEWGAMARVAASVSSLLSLPRKPSDPEALPVGGVSDVTNRGEPERLLMTELAQDPMVMLARIANGQALYLRRESPPGPSPQFRPVLIESGIRTWGENRLQIASMALAIAAAEEQRGETAARLLTIAGERSIEEDFSNRAGVVEHLGRLHHHEQPSEAIRNWIEQLDEAEEILADPILIVTAATDRDERFRRALDRMPGGYLIARIERDLSATLLRRTPLGDETLQTVSLAPIDPPEGASKQAKPTTRRHQRDPSLPLILDVEPSPLRFSNHLDGNWLMSAADPGLFTITRDRRLLYFDDPSVGAIHLLDRVPPGMLLAHEVTPTKLSLVVGDTHRVHSLVEVDRETTEARMVQLQTGGGTSIDYEFDQGALFRFGGEIQLFCRETGARLAADAMDQWRHVGAAVVVHGRDIRLVSQAGSQIEYHTVSDPLGGKSVGLAIRRHDDSIALISLDYQRLVLLDGENDIRTLRDKTMTLRDRRTFTKVDYRSIDGSLIVVGDGRTSMNSRVNRIAIDLQHATIAEDVPARYSHLLTKYDREASRLVRPRSVISRLSGVTIVHGQTIVLVKSRTSWAIEYASGHGRIVLREVGRRGDTERHLRHFGRTTHVDSPLGPTAWHLKSIAFGENRIFVDSRGLLHLRRGDDQSEVTLVLHEPHVSGWTSWGEQFGDGYFLVGESLPTSRTVISWLKEFARQCSQSN